MQEGSARGYCFATREIYAKFRNWNTVMRLSHCVCVFECVFGQQALCALQGIGAPPKRWGLGKMIVAFNETLPSAEKR